VPEDVTSTLDDVTAYLAEHGSELVAVRRELHAHPELSGQEVRTTAMLEERLRAAGLRPERLARGTGLVCDIGGSTGPTVALRADIDALAMVDRKDVSYRSQVDGAAHACGHDVHTTVVLGAGLALQASGALAAGGGRVRLVFEPSEESLPGGAVDVLAEGWFDDVDAVFGIHCDPKVDVGHLGVRVGALTSSTDMIAVTVRGPGGHTARPELTVNLLAVVGRLLSELPGRVASLATGPVRVVFGSVHAGDAANVIPVEAVVRGTFRTPDREVWAQAGKLVDAAVEQTLAGTGASWVVEHVRGVPPVVNDRAATGLLADCATAALGPDGVVEMEQSWGGDSFAWFTEQVPGSYGRLGVHDPTSSRPRLDLHAGTFDVDERCIGTGVRVLATTAVAMLRRLRDAAS
jgi:amidohydrolase